MMMTSGTSTPTPDAAATVTHTPKAGSLANPPPPTTKPEATSDEASPVSHLEEEEEEEEMVTPPGDTASEQEETVTPPGDTESEQASQQEEEEEEEEERMPQPGDAAWPFLAIEAYDAPPEEERGADGVPLSAILPWSRDPRRPATTGATPPAASLVDAYAGEGSDATGAAATVAPAVDESLNARVSLVTAQIVAMGADAIVNAANAGLHAGGGVCGAIFHAAGHRRMRDECDVYRDAAASGGGGGACPTGRAVLTHGHRLPARYCVHAVGPAVSGGGGWGGGPTARDTLLLARVYRAVFDLLPGSHRSRLFRGRPGERPLTSVVVPCISTAIYGFPHALAAWIVARTARAFLERHPAHEAERLVFIFYPPDEHKDLPHYLAAFDYYFPRPSSAAVPAASASAATAASTHPPASPSPPPELDDVTD